MLRCLLQKKKISSFVWTFLYVTWMAGDPTRMTHHQNEMRAGVRVRGGISGYDITGGLWSYSNPRHLKITCRHKIMRKIRWIPFIPLIIFCFVCFLHNLLSSDFFKNTGFYLITTLMGVPTYCMTLAACVNFPPDTNTHLAQLVVAPIPWEITI